MLPTNNERDLELVSRDQAEVAKEILDDSSSLMTVYERAIVWANPLIHILAPIGELFDGEFKKEYDSIRMRDYVHELSDKIAKSESEGRRDLRVTTPYQNHIINRAVNRAVEQGMDVGSVPIALPWKKARTLLRKYKKYT